MQPRAMVLVLAVVAFPGGARAQEAELPPPAAAPAADPAADPAAFAPASAPPAASARAVRPRRARSSNEEPGTHYLIELAGGSTTYGGGGPVFYGLFGGGGKPSFLPLRVYLIAEMAYAQAGTSGETALLRLPYQDDRRYGDLAVGLRLFLPIYGGLRFFVDGLLGGSHVSAQLERQELGTLQASGWAPLGELALGFQYRLTRQLSIGLRGRLQLTDDDVAGLRAMVGDGSPLRSAVTVSTTWHF